ncbi:hypothetical protein CRV03_01450 [Arcobacter sp. F155]|uniref:hypothetical protein n=1 Tax=Arcobacter sp. F155 TaxID=2044512 RepID=UPI00100ADFE3|nr:hypothetical protein [Arcobacter sp. F155]RXJ78723.1 hypothetical protein CRV03_01450 [Arcobacter sp. F155]
MEISLDTQMFSQTTYSKKEKTTSEDSFSSYLKTTQEISSNMSEEEQKQFEEKNALGIQRYNTWFKNDNGHYFDGTVLQRDENLRNDFIEYISGMDDREFLMLNVNLWSSFSSGLVEDENGNIVSGNPPKNVKEEFSSLGSIKRYFEDEIDTLEQNAQKFGGDPSEMINLLSDVLSFFKGNSVEDDDTSSKKEETAQKEEENIEETKALYEDILSLLKTGFTTSELETIQKLLIELKEKSKEGNYSKSEVEEMLSNAEKEIAKLQKRVSGEVVIKNNENSLSSEENSLDEDSKNFLQRIEKAMKTIDTLALSKDIRENSAKESEILQMINQFKQ